MSSFPFAPLKRRRSTSPDSISPAKKQKQMIAAGNDFMQSGPSLKGRHLDRKKLKLIATQDPGRRRYRLARLFRKRRQKQITATEDRQKHDQSLETVQKIPFAELTGSSNPAIPSSLGDFSILFNVSGSEAGSDGPAGTTDQPWDDVLRGDELQIQSIPEAVASSDVALSWNGTVGLSIHPHAANYPNLTFQSASTSSYDIEHDGPVEMDGPTGQDHSPEQVTGANNPSQGEISIFEDPVIDVDSSTQDPGLDSVLREGTDTLFDNEEVTNLVRVALPAQKTGDNVGEQVLSEKALGKRRAAEYNDERGSMYSGTAIPLNTADTEMEGYGMHIDEESGNSSHSRRLDTEEIYDHLLRHPNSPCTNAAVALLCELVVDLKSTIICLRDSTEPAAVNEEPGKACKPQVGYHETRKSSSSSSNRNRDRKRQPSYLVELKADVRRLMHEFLEYPEKILTVPAAAQLKQYKEGHPMATGPSLNPLVLDLASKGVSSWNKKAARLFREAFQSLEISDCDNQDLIEATFLTHVNYLRKLYLKQSLDVEGKVDAAEQVKYKARYARRKELRERRFKNALLPYQHIPHMKAIRTTLSTFPAEVVSEDERQVVDEQECYLVVRLDWRSSDASSMCEILDALHMASHFTVNDQPRPGRFSHPRTHSRRVYTGSAPPGLPANLYNPEYLSSLHPDELDVLNIQPKVDLCFPAGIMRIAARFRHVKCRSDIPLPRNHSSLGTYIEGQMYTAFVD